MKDFITMYSADLDNLKIALNFKIIGDTIRAKSFEILEDGSLVIYWNEQCGTPFVTPMNGYDLYPTLAQYFKANNVTDREFPGDGSNVKGFKFTTNVYAETDLKVKNRFYVSCIFKLVWIYYGK